LIGSAAATGTMTAVANARQAAAVSTRRFIALPFRTSLCMLLDRTVPKIGVRCP
jgi:hypothetical protein